MTNTRRNTEPVQLAAALIVLATLLPAGASAQATLNKCIDAQGTVTYSNLPCRGAREARTVEIMPPAAPDTPTPAAGIEPASRFRIEPPTAAAANPPGRASERECAALTDSLGRQLDRMDEARRKGYSQAEMDVWNEEIRTLERAKQQSGCF